MSRTEARGFGRGVMIHSVANGYRSGSGRRCRAVLSARKNA
jgi:hypothetical protein